MEPLKIKDNTSYNSSIMLNCKNLTNCILNKTLHQLEHEGLFIFPRYINNSEDLTRDQLVLQTINNSIRTGNVMGVVGHGTERLIIESRFSNNRNDYFFKYLLKRVLDLPNIVDLETDANKDKQLFNLLLFMFPQYLRAAMRKGLYKEYINRKSNDYSSTY